MEIKKLESNSSFIFFNWPLCDKCNYNCSYCSTENDNTWEHQKYKFVISKLKMIKKTFRVCLTGGETTEHSEIKNIINELSNIEYLDKVFLFTNLSKNLDFYNQIEIKDNIVITASYHPEYHNKSFFYKCLELNKLRYNNFRVNISISDDEKYYQKTKELFDFLIKNNIQYNINFLMNTPKKIINYSDNIYLQFEKYFCNTKMYDELTATFSDNSQKILSNHEFRKLNINNFKNYLCCCQTYQINKEAEFIKTCTNEKMPLFLKPEYFEEFIKCPLERCEGDGKITYTKIKEN